MDKFPFLTAAQADKMLRIAVALFLIAHGIARLYLGTVGGFGEFLNSQGFVIGTALAWGITLFEIAGGITLAMGYFVPWVAVLFIVQLVMGIILVHAQNGWFVVGATLGGMEYSTLLIIVLLVVAAHDRRN